MEQHATVSKTTFLISWVLLILLTFAMLRVGTTATIPLLKRDAMILGMMLVQAYLVSFYFMHLRFEKIPLVLSVVLGVIVTTLLLYALIIWDGSRIVQLTGG